jgi:predicted RNase H-like nuclease (RuvC/YqgF family)
MENDSTAIIIALITSGVSLVVGVLGFVRQLRKDNSDEEQAQATSTAAITATALTLIEPLNERIEDLEKQCSTYRSEAVQTMASIANLQAEIKHYKRELARRDKRIEFLISGIRVLTGQLCDEGIQPAFVMDFGGMESGEGKGEDGTDGA